MRDSEGYPASIGYFDTTVYDLVRFSLGRWRLYYKTSASLFPCQINYSAPRDMMRCCIHTLTPLSVSTLLFCIYLFFILPLSDLVFSPVPAALTQKSDFIFFKSDSPSRIHTFSLLYGLSECKMNSMITQCCVSDRNLLVKESMCPFRNLFYRTVLCH